MIDYKQYFKKKRVTVVGLGLLGKRIGDIIFLAECGAKVLVTDLKTKEELVPSLRKLKKYKNIKYALGGHRFEDFENTDFVLKGQGVALDSLYINHAKERGIPIEMDESLFAKLAPGVKIIGVTGTRGKSTTTILIYEILKASGMSVHLGGNIKGTAALPLLKKVKDGDTVVFELSSWQLQGFGDIKMSPHISVFTNFMPDHMNYYQNDLKRYFADKAYIYEFQKKNDFLILGPHMKGMVDGVKSKIINTEIKNIPRSWNIALKGEHNKENISCAIAVARILKIPENTIKETIENFQAVPGRLELVKNFKGVEIYNDTNSCTPEATSVALRALGHPMSKSGKKIILIMGGSDKNLDFTNLFQDINKFAKAVVLIPGNGTERIISNFQFPIFNEKAKDLKDAMEKAFAHVKKGDIILFSPAFTSFGMFNNEYDRGDKFMKIVNKLN